MGILNVSHLIVTGTGYPRPAPGCAGPSALVLAGESKLLFDCGRGAVMRLREQGLLPHELNALFVTHFHSDHVSDLPDLAMTSWLLAPNHEPLQVFGAEGVSHLCERVEDFMRSDVERRARHKGEAAPENLLHSQLVDHKKSADPVKVWSHGDVRVLMAAVKHGYVREAVGYRIEHGDRAIAISGDTTECKGVSLLARGCDVLLHEILDLERLREATGGAPSYVEDYHSTPEQVGRMATKAGAKRLVLTHIIPAVRDESDAEALRSAVSAHFDGEVIVARDGTVVEW